MEGERAEGATRRLDRVPRTFARLDSASADPRAGLSSVRGSLDDRPMDTPEQTKPELETKPETERAKTPRLEIRSSVRAGVANDGIPAMGNPGPIQFHGSDFNAA